METFRAHTDCARLQFYKHQVVWWKSQYVAAQYENKMLRALLDKVYQLPEPVSSLRRSLKRRRNKHKKKSRKIIASRTNEENESDESVEFEMSEEFKQFLDINRQHREERDRDKALVKKVRGSESESERVERMESEPTDEAACSRREQLMLLYGDNWKHVEGLETHVQMKYDQFCDVNKPAYWPNIPLNL